MRIVIGSSEKMIQAISGKCVICWGIGNYFQAFLDFLEQYKDIFEIKYLIDQSKHGQTYFAYGKQVCIYDKEYMFSNWKNEVLVITTAQYTEILKTIEIREHMQDIVCCIYPAVIPYAERGENPYKLNFPCIPKKIHYCWFGGNPIPVKDQIYINGWKEKNPDYELILWNEDNYNLEENPYLKKMYREKKWAFISDYVRLDVLYKEGGFYFDTDVEMLRSLEELRYQRAFIGTEITGNINSGAGVGGEEGNGLIGEIRDSYLDMGSNSYSTNAARETEILRRYGFKANHKWQCIKGMTIYPYSYFSPKQIGGFEDLITEDTYSIHHYNYSWMAQEQRDNIGCSQAYIQKMVVRNTE